MTVVDADNLADRMRRISELTETLFALEANNDRAGVLAEDIDSEIAVARLQIRFYKPLSDISDAAHLR